MKKINDEIFVNPMFCCDPSDCLIHRDDFEAYLKHNEKWPVSGHLANWFDDAKPKSSKRKIREPEVNRLRSDHVKAWVTATHYQGGKLDKTINDELRNEEPELWGETLYTFRKWRQSHEGKEVIYLLPNKRRK